MRIVGSILVVVLTLLSAVTVVSAEEPNNQYNLENLFSEQKEYNSRELIVKFKPSVSYQQRLGMLQSLKVKEISSIDKGDFSLVTVSRAEDLIPLADELLQRSEIEYAEPNYEISSAYTPQDSEYNKQWYLNKIQMPKAWGVTKGASNITVAIIDSGVQLDHSELKEKITHPFNMVTGNPYIIGDMHGTHVAGIIAAAMNQTGVAGIAPNVKIMPVNVFDGDAASVYDVVNGIYYATDMEANIINLSLGSQTYSQALANAVNYARSKGVLIVAAAGNENTYLRTYPAAFPGVIGVSATNSNDEITKFSNYGDYIDLSAPGERIFSTINGSSYQYLDGTSMAAPVVSGVSALLLSKNPFLTPADIETILSGSAHDLGLEGRDYYFGAGRVDAYNALQKTPIPASPVKVSKSSFRIEGTNKIEFSIDIYKGTKVTIEVSNSKGSVAKRLVSNKNWNGGKMRLSWDGKQKDGKYASSGTYKIFVKITNGKETIHKNTTFIVKNAVIPVVKTGKAVSYSPVEIKYLSIPFTLNKNAKVIASIYSSKNKKIKKISTGTTFDSGKHSIFWSGKDSKGKKVADGKYKLLIYAVDSQNRKSVKRWVDIKVDTIKPKASVATSHEFKVDGKNKAKLKLKLTESSYVTVSITTSKGTRVKKLVSKKKYSAGLHTLSWDGKNSKNQYVAESKYNYRVGVSDRAGNKKALQTQSFYLRDLRKPAIQAKSKVEFKSFVETSLAYKVNKSGYVKVQLFQNGVLIRTAQPYTRIKAGTHYFKWNGKNKSGKIVEDGKIQYKITFKDAHNQITKHTGNMVIKGK